MKHARARNVIEICFGLLKRRCAILRSPSFFLTRTQGHVVIACFLLHNLIKRFMDEEEFIYEDNDDDNDDDTDKEAEFITTVATFDHWIIFTNTLAQNMFSGWKAKFR